MTLDTPLRLLKDRLVAPLAARSPLSPTALTGLGLAAGLACAASMAAPHPSTAVSLGLWALNRLLDGLDGAVARTRGAASDFGSIADIVADFTVYAAVPLGVAARASGGDHGGGSTASLWATVAALEGVFFVNAASLFCTAAVVEKRGRAGRPEVTGVTLCEGWVGGTETAVVYAALVGRLGGDAAVRPVCVAVGVAVAATVVQRLVWAHKHLT